MNNTSGGAQRPVVICGPSGCGKSTIIRMLIQQYPHAFSYCVSHTTRPKRPDEIYGKDYYFVSEDDFQKAVQKEQFVEHGNFSGYYYGTSKEELDRVLKSQRIILMDMDIHGMEHMQKSSYNPICIFIRPRNFATLEKRLRLRSTETEDRILQHLAVAHQEMQYGISDGQFDAVIVNDDINQALKQLVELLGEVTNATFPHPTESKK
ncbi:hypothetical protein T265_10799 [Opisthorchis viverrini]|uniref:guanylate kinase n=1 Tax=Opisthorchis viverrini TaxID=6198 RepID=A0A074Z194_OPIVI|nr:hypothetical protein T265_10799 [Opisthorchis viverrini]KER20723.1 hypothetical protein T265_10799 [Opisthorchis viverrini]